MFEEVDARIPENKHDAINDFLRRKKSIGVSPHTLEKYAYTFRLFFHQSHPDVSPAEAEIGHFEEFLQWLDQRYRKESNSNQGLKPKTKRTRLDPLSSFYTWAMQRPSYPEITANPARVVMSEIRTSAPPRPDCATWENAKKIVSHIADPRNKTIAVILAKTGCRLNECLEIKEEDLLLDEGFIRLRERKGGKQGMVPIDDETIFQIKRYQMMQDFPDRDHLFVSELGNRLCTQMVQDCIHDAAVATEIQDEDETRFAKKFTPHTFRTVFTTLMRDEGMDTHILEAIRGDEKSSSNMVDRYTRIDRDRMRSQYLDCIKSLEL